MSFYWAVVTMATLGFGDIKPYTTYEIVMVIICLTVGASFFETKMTHCNILQARARSHGLLARSHRCLPSSTLDTGNTETKLPGSAAK